MSKEAAQNDTKPLAPEAEQGFIRRYRLPLLLAIVAVCLYVGSILYILYGRGQVA